MKNKIAVVILCAMLLALGSSADAQQPAKIPRIGVLSTAGDSRIPGFQIEAFRKGLLDIGYIDGKNVLVDYRYAEGNQDRLPPIVAELVQLKVDVLVVTALTALRVAKQATQTIPTVMVILSDPVATAPLLQGKGVDGRLSRRAPCRSGAAATAAITSPCKSGAAATACAKQPGQRAGDASARTCTRSWSGLTTSTNSTEVYGMQTVLRAERPQK